MVPLVVEGIDLQERAADATPRPHARPPVRRAQPVRPRVLVRLTTDGGAVVYTDDATVEVTVLRHRPD